MPLREVLRRFHGESIRVVRARFQSGVEEFSQSVDLVDEKLVASERVGGFGVGPLGACRAADDATLCGPGEQVLESLESLDPAPGAADDCFSVRGE